MFKVAAGCDDMAIPDFQTLMKPLLSLFGDGEEHSNRECHDRIVEELGITHLQSTELLKSGRQTRLANRIAWALSYMGQAGLVETTGRGKRTITDRGLQALRDDTDRIDIPYLSQFPEFQIFRGRARSTAEPRSSSVLTDVSVATPQEALEESFKLLRASLAQDLLERIKAASPSFFENLVVELLVSMGYGGSREDAGEAVGRSGDGGIDGIIKEDRLGLDFIYVQAKRWNATVGRPDIQAFAGSLEGQRARKGVFITTSQFTREAYDYVSRIEKRIVLIEGAELAELMIDYGVGVTEVATYQIYRLDADYFDDA